MHASERGESVPEMRSMNKRSSSSSSYSADCSRARMNSYSCSCCRVHRIEEFVWAFLKKSSNYKPGGPGPPYLASIKCSSTFVLMHTSQPTCAVLLYLYRTSLTSSVTSASPGNTVFPAQYFGRFDTYKLKHYAGNCHISDKFSTHVWHIFEIQHWERDQKLNCYSSLLLSGEHCTARRDGGHH